MERGQRWRDILVLVALILLLSFFYLTGIETVVFHGDESQWIGSSTVFEEFFTAKFDSPLWDESYWTLTQPPVARYVIGMGRRIGGHGWADVQAHAHVDAMSSDSLLWWSRLPMPLLGVVSFVIGFVLIQKAAGQLAGYVWILLSIISTFFMRNLRRAMGEAVLLVCVAFATLSIYKILALLKTGKSARFWKIFIWFGILGIIAGVAGASKLNGLAVVLAGVVLAVIVAIKLGGSFFSRLFFGASAILTVILLSSLTFVGLNPYLWPDPASRTWKMYEHRLDEIDYQRQLFPDQSLDGLGERIKVIPERVFQTYTALDFKGSFIINLVFFVAGLWYLVRKSWRSFSKGVIDPVSTAVVLVGLVVIAPSLFTPLDWDRYYLFPVFFTTFFIAIGIAVFIEGACRFTRTAYERFSLELV